MELGWRLTCRYQNNPNGYLARWALAEVIVGSRKTISAFLPGTKGTFPNYVQAPLIQLFCGTIINYRTPSANGEPRGPKTLWLAFMGKKRNVGPQVGLYRELCLVGENCDPR